MSEHMNPDYPKNRGCFIDEVTNKGTFSVVDFPTWHLKNGEITAERNEPILDGTPYMKDFSTKADAIAFCEAENYIVCQVPKKVDPNRKEVVMPSFQYNED